MPRVTYSSRRPLPQEADLPPVGADDPLLLQMPQLPHHGAAVRGDVVRQNTQGEGQREHILPSERALAYKMKLDAMRRSGGRPSKENVSQIGTQKRSDQIMAEELGESRNQIQRFIRLTNLIPELLDMVDEKKISFNPAVELSYLDESQQRDFLEAMEDTQNAPSLSQAQQLKKMAQQGELSYEKAFDVMGQEKRSEKDTVTIKNETLRKYFPRSYTPKQMEEKIVQLLDAWQKKQRRNER